MKQLCFLSSSKEQTRQGWGEGKQEHKFFKLFLFLLSLEGGEAKSKELNEEMMLLHRSVWCGPAQGSAEAQGASLCSPSPQQDFR